MIDTWTHGKKVDAPRRGPPPKPAISMQQNDLWVAATAHESQAVLLSTDKDFEHMKEIWFGFYYVDQKYS